MIDEPGPWGTGPFTLVQGASSITTRAAIMSADPFRASWLIESEQRDPQVVLEANLDHWNRAARGPRIERAVFRNDLTPDEALRLVCDTEGEVDIVTEVSPADARRVQDSAHARLVVCDANRVLVGIINRDYPVLLAGALTITIFVLVLNLVVDILVGVLDPRRVKGSAA